MTGRGREPPPQPRSGRSPSRPGSRGPGSPRQRISEGQAVRHLQRLPVLVRHEAAPHQGAVQHPHGHRQRRQGRGPAGSAGAGLRGGPAAGPVQHRAPPAEPHRLRPAPRQQRPRGSLHRRGRRRGRGAALARPLRLRLLLPRCPARLLPAFRSGAAAPALPSSSLRVRARVAPRPRRQHGGAAAAGGAGRGARRGQRALHLPAPLPAARRSAAPRAAADGRRAGEEALREPEETARGEEMAPGEETASPPPAGSGTASAACPRAARGLLLLPSCSCRPQRAPPARPGPAAIRRQEAGPRSVPACRGAEIPIKI